MINEYELVFIVAPNAGADKTDKIKEKLTKIFNTHKAEISLDSDWGNRKLAYRMDKFEYGHYFFYRFKADGKIVDELEKILNIDESILRFITVKLNPLKEGEKTPPRVDIPEETNFKPSYE
jgi:small subunit ribosomal protein S6